MNASQIVNDTMTLDEKLAAIDAAMEEQQEAHRQKFPGEAPLDPMDLLQCEGCQ